LKHIAKQEHFSKITQPHTHTHVPTVVFSTGAAAIDSKQT